MTEDEEVKIFAKKIEAASFTDLYVRGCKAFRVVENNSKCAQGCCRDMNLNRKPAIFVFDAIKKKT